MYKPYTGVGARATPKGVSSRMTKFASLLPDWTLRSGGANGADSAFENGALNKEIFLPWKGFNSNDSPLFTQSQEARDIAEKIHPKWTNLTEGMKKLHARNIHQVLGKDLNSPSLFLVCWTENGEEIGGTRTAIICAKENNIPVFNLAKDCAKELWNFVKSLGTVQ
jgi:hypothetical protein